MIDTSYEALDQLARTAHATPHANDPAPHAITPLNEPAPSCDPPADLGLAAPSATGVAGRDVWLVHPWCLGELPSDLLANPVVIGVFVADFHRAWPWSERRWRFVGQRMAELTEIRWHGDIATIGGALSSARSVRSMAEPHLAPWLAAWADCQAAPTLFPPIDRRCDSFSQWWARVSRGSTSVADLLLARQ